MKELVLAGGCFWGIDEFYRRKKGVVNTESGYANCRRENPSYEQVCTGMTGCAEAVRIEYDETVIQTEEIVDLLFSVIDPRAINRQGPDVGTQYRSGLYYSDATQKEIFEAAVKRLEEKSDQPIATEVLPLENFFPAEDYHQKYLVKNPSGYCHIPLD